MAKNKEKAKVPEQIKNLDQPVDALAVAMVRIEQLEQLNAALRDHISNTPLTKEFTGIARTVQCFKHFEYRNFKVVTLNIEAGVVKDIKYSDPYATFEAISQMEMTNEIAIHNLNMHWKEGVSLQK